jgi:hypothetical protein
MNSKTLLQMTDMWAEKNLNNKDLTEEEWLDVKEIYNWIVDHNKKEMWTGTLVWRVLHNMKEIGKRFE